MALSQGFVSCAQTLTCYPTNSVEIESKHAQPGFRDAKKLTQT